MIFSTVIDTLKNFIQTESPESIMFTAEKENDSDSRTSLYSKMVTALAKNLGYDSKIFSDEKKTTFELTKLPL